MSGAARQRGAPLRAHLKGAGLFTSCNDSLEKRAHRYQCICASADDFADVYNGTARGRSIVAGGSSPYFASACGARIALFRRRTRVAANTRGARISRVNFAPASCTTPSTCFTTM
jgi:hypothetical protein